MTESGETCCQEVCEVASGQYMANQLASVHRYGRVHEEVASYHGRVVPLETVTQEYAQEVCVLMACVQCVYCIFFIFYFLFFFFFVVVDSGLVGKDSDSEIPEQMNAYYSNRETRVNSYSRPSLLNLNKLKPGYRKITHLENMFEDMNT